MNSKDQETLRELADILSQDGCSITFDRELALTMAVGLREIADRKETFPYPYPIAEWREEIDIALQVQACPNADAELRRISAEWLAGIFKTDNA